MKKEADEAGFKVSRTIDMTRTKTIMAKNPDYLFLKYSVARILFVFFLYESIFSLFNAYFSTSSFLFCSTASSTAICPKYFAPLISLGQ